MAIFQHKIMVKVVKIQHNYYQKVTFFQHESSVAVKKLDFISSLERYFRSLGLLSCGGNCLEMSYHQTMAKYKTGDIAKRAGVTARTIQFYDSIGLLHPSFVDDKGYRYYSDEDMARLQKILCLKTLGFSLDEIRTMTATDSYTSIKEAIHYQIKAIESKISSLTKLRENLLSFSDAPDWGRMMRWKDI